MNVIKSGLFVSVALGLDPRVGLNVDVGVSDTISEVLGRGVLERELPIELEGSDVYEAV